MNNILEYSDDWLVLQDLIDFGINYSGDGWYKGNFDQSHKWAYIVHDTSDGSYLFVSWKDDPRPQLKIMLGAEVRE